MQLSLMLFVVLERILLLFILLPPLQPLLLRKHKKLLLRLQKLSCLALEGSVRCPCKQAWLNERGPHRTPLAHCDMKVPGLEVQKAALYRLH